MRSRTRSALLALALTALPVSSGAQSVFLSELCDPKQNFLTDRFIEIYNAGLSTVDLTGWSVVAIGNGVDIFTWNLSGTIDAGEALVAGDLVTVVAFPVDFADDAWSASNSTWNGKVGDGAKLLGPGAVLVDLIQATGTTFENEDLVRNADITVPNTVYTPSEWTGTAVEFPTQGTPGTHTVSGPPPGPSVTNLVLAPALPASADSVDVSVCVTDSTGTIVTVELNWGTSSGSLPNNIALAAAGGDVYTTVTPIPAQVPGTTVYFEVLATNDVPVVGSLLGQNYQVPFEVSLFQIQGSVPVSPYDGDQVLTGGVVTADFGTHFVIQDGAGAWNGLWAQSAGPMTVGDSVTVRGLITENGISGYTANTLLAQTQVLATAAGAVPSATVINSLGMSAENHEGVLVTVPSVECTNPALGLGEWEVDDGSGAGRVGDLGYAFTPTLGTVYDVTGVGTYTDGDYKVEPRSAADVIWVADAFAPVINVVTVTSDSTLLVSFSEDLDLASSETAGNYSIPGLTVGGATQVSGSAHQVVLDVSPMSPTTYTLTATGVEDLFGNATSGAMLAFEYVDTAPPAGYYDPAEGLTGVALQSALHDIIDMHTVIPYSSTWTSFMTTDDKPNGKVWDMYSDIPGGTPPYEYTFGVDQGGVGGMEGTGYNREHSWPQSWFGGSVSPMDSDLFLLYPTDNYVNGQRGSFPFGEVLTPSWTSLNGSELGSNTYPGYVGTVFEPIDAYKGDFARTYFYMSTRYYQEDAGWPGSPMATGSQMLPWAVAMMLDWHAADPVSQKEINRNGTVFEMQFNRNPFIDRPEFVDLIWSPALSTGPVVAPLAFELLPNAPNPFASATRISFALPSAAHARLSVYDAAGRRVATLWDGMAERGRHDVVWDSRNVAGRPVAAGVYFYRIDAGDHRETRRLVVLR
ncbi:MAG: T9SS type A sorting domain-containing protein [Gemmatimonadetes bacterium]|nr:T9SS type A sorting domain-containing protein [Gemmatimonadota bacterium]